jgi:hypothetical protein
MPSSSDKFNNDLKRRRGVAVEDPSETPLPENAGTADYQWQARNQAQARRDRDARLQKQQREQQKEEKRANAVTATGGTNLDAQTLEAQKAYEAERRAPKTAPVTFTHDSVMALLEKYFSSEAGKTIYLTPDNYESFGNRFVKGLCLGEFDLTLKAAGQVHAELLAAGFLELAPGLSYDPATGVTVRKRGDVTRPASRVYPRFFHHSHAIQAQLVEMHEGQQRFREETQQLKQDLDSGKLSFADLQKQVRKGFKPEGGA